MTESKQKYRHELKYVISTPQMSLLMCRISSIMQRDPYVGADGIYTISSLYFDDYHNRCFYENENGIDPREKFRIRIYNHSLERITLECKRKERGKTHKIACPLTPEQAKTLSEGKIPPLTDNQPPLLKKLILEMRMRRMRPVVIVEYERIPYIYKNGNVRITFDTQISSSTNTEHFLSCTTSKRPVMPTGKHLMEVKFDEYLPDFIYYSLNLHQLQQTAYSKYYLCRKFSLNK